MTKIFITGESGTIPMAIQKIASEFDCKVVNSQLEENFFAPCKSHQSFKVRKPEIDFLNKQLLIELFEQTQGTENEPDVFIHSGAFVGTDFCSSNEALAIKTNIEGTKNIVDVCNTLGKPLIYFSTTAIMDPKGYSDSFPITEQTKIDPQTLYGITKYTGELIVKNMCKTPNIVVRPVFGFGNYPDDLHSALTKMIYVMARNILKKDSSLTILLNPDISKSYTRVENIATCVLRIVDRIRNHHGKIYFNSEAFNIGIDRKSAVNWDVLKRLVASEFVNKSLCTSKEFFDIYSKKILFKPDADYLHYHNMSSEKLVKLGLDFENNVGFISLAYGIRMTCDSVLKNIDKEPYWL